MEYKKFATWFSTTNIIVKPCSESKYSILLVRTLVVMLINLNLLILYFPMYGDFGMLFL